MSDLHTFMLQHDDDFTPTVNSFDNKHHPSARLIIESVYVDHDVPSPDPVLPEDAGPPDPPANDEQLHKSLLKLRYRLRMNALNHGKPRPIPSTESTIVFEGQDWTSNSDGTWTVPTELSTESLPTTSFTYEDAALTSEFKIHRVAAPLEPPTLHTNVKPAHAQSDTGANANCTNDLSILHDVQWIEPISCTTANVGADLNITAIGRMFVTCGKVCLPVIMYYSENAPGTILSPNAICRQFHSSFFGYQKRVDFDRKMGDIRFTAREGLEDVFLQVTCINDLWYHSDLNIIPETDAYEPPVPDSPTDHMCQQCQPKINFLSDAAKFELWHQRLGHIGKSKLEILHKHADGVPKLRGNSFYKCPACMAGKLCTKNPVRNANLGTPSAPPPSAPDPSHIPVDAPAFSSDWEHVDTDDIDDWEAYLDELHLPDTKPGMNFHADFGFVRGSMFRLKTETGKTITSIDGKNSYCLVVDRATRYIWVYIGDSKEPPVEAVRMILEKFGAKNTTHRTFRTDRDKGLNLSKDFCAMIAKADFTVELTGPDSSDQNGIAERPHRDLGQMMRCMLHSSGLGPQYWSFALQQAVFVKNRIPHSKLGTTPFQAFTGKRANLSNVRVFGSRVYARTTGDKPAKLDYHTNQGIFLSFCATDSNIYYIDDESQSIRTGRHVLFDEAHMTVPAGKAPLAAQALQRLGYYVRESWIDTTRSSEHASDLTNSMQVQLLTPTAIPPTRATENSIGFDVHLDLDTVTIQPNSTSLLSTGIAAKAPAGTYLRIAPRSGLTVTRDLHTLAGVVDPDYTGNIVVVLRNFGTTPQVFSRGDKIAQIIVEQARTPSIQLVPQLARTMRADSGFGSSDPIDILVPDDFIPAQLPITDPVLPKLKEPPDTHIPLSLAEVLAARTRAKLNFTPNAAAAASLRMDSVTLTFPDDVVQLPIPDPDSIFEPVDISISKVQRLAKDIHLSFDMPYDIGLSPSPFDNQTSRDFQLFGSDPLLGIAVEMCPNFGMPRLKECKKSTPCARIPRWRSELRGAYITQVNTVPVTTVDSIRVEIAKARLDKATKVTIGFATISKQSMHPQKGIPQMYHDQMNVIGKHLWDMANDPEWNSDVENALPLLEVIRKDPMKFSPADRKKLKDLLSIHSLKKQRKLTRKILKDQDDWEDWRQSEFKQLDQYEDQQTFGEPQERPHGSNLLSLIWVYMIKDDGRKKARCVCNGSKNMRGTVTLAETYASSLEQNAARVFWAATALKNWKTIGADAANAFAEADAPVAPLYVRIDEQYREWFKHKYPDRPQPKPGAVMRVKKALQGHPESPRLWATLIDKVIQDLNLSPCTHEPNLYYTNNYKGTGKEVLFLRQVDDFAISCEDDEVSKDCIQAINSKMSIEVKELGLIDRFNGIDVDQTRDYIKLYNATYITKILRNHPWILEDEFPPAIFPIPMRSDSTFTHSLETADPLTEQDRLALETKLGFSYRQAIGELIYALVTCRPDISFATIKLSQYSAAPALCHFAAVKDIFRYLQATKDDGIYYWRREPRLDLPKKPLPSCKSDDNYDELAVPERQECQACCLTGAVDSDHAGDVSHRKSVSGIILKLAGGAVLYKTAFQTTIAQSSTEAEFTAAADAGKYILYLRSLLAEIGLMQEDATILFEDNQGALLMANAQRPTKRTRHMDIKAFGLQDWVQRDLLCLKRIATADNYSDAMTKNVGRTLFYRHMNFVMGRVVPVYAYKRGDLSFRVLYDKTGMSLEFLRFLSREGVKRRSLIPIGLGCS